jgi:IS30 family transposase
VKWGLQSRGISLHTNTKNRVFSRFNFSTYNLSNIKIPQPRTPLGVISGNIQKNKELTPYQREKIIAAAQFGHSPSEIAKVLERPKSTVQTTLKLDSIRYEGHTRGRSGRPREYNERDVRNLVRYIRANPKDTWEQVKRACGFTWHKDIFKRMLEPSGITNWKCRHRPHLTETTVKKRLAWCKSKKD